MKVRPRQASDHQARRKRVALGANVAGSGVGSLTASVSASSRPESAAETAKTDAVEKNEIAKKAETAAVAAKWV